MKPALRSSCPILFFGHAGGQSCFSQNFCGKYFFSDQNDFFSSIAKLRFKLKKEEMESAVVAQNNFIAERKQASRVRRAVVAVVLWLERLPTKLEGPDRIPTVSKV